MWLLVVLIVMILVIPGFFFLLGRNAAINRDIFRRKYCFAAKIFLGVYMIFEGCFLFPVKSEKSPLDFIKLYLLIVSYAILGLGLAGVYGPKKEKVIYPLALVLTAAGMACRYLLEYGEVSNTYNFTVLNVAVYLAVMPAFTVLAYHYIVKHMEETT